MNGIEGLDKLLAQFAQIENMDFVSAEVDALKVIAEEARNLVPVDTGALQITIDVEVDGDTVSLVAGGGEVDYALFVEFGTVKMQAQPFMRPAIDTKGNDAVKAAGKNLEAQMKRIANG